MVRFLKMAILAGVPSGLLMGLFFAAMYGDGFGIPGAVAFGLFSGILMAGFAAWQRSRFSGKNPCRKGEQLLREGPANHLRRWESVGGWLYLTDRRLLFQPHRFNLQTQELSIPLEEILGAEPCATAWIIPNGLRVLTDSGTERFVVEGRRAWAETINFPRKLSEEQARSSVTTFRAGREPRGG